MTEFNKDALCRICPARSLKEGDFKVEDPDSMYGYRVDRTLGVRTNPEGMPTCAHPERLGRAVLALAEASENGGPAQAASLEDIDFSAVPEDMLAAGPWASSVIASLPEAQVMPAVRRLELSIRDVHGSKIAVDAARLAFDSWISKQSGS